jgi:hypothetical protein
MHHITTGALLGLQSFVALFVGLHNWIPLGALNNVKAVRAEFPGSKLLKVTLLNFTPVVVGLAGSAFYLGKKYPPWLLWWLWIFYLLACYGSLKEWWIPYFSRPETERVARYQAMYGATHAFLPARNGIRPNTLHVIFDVVTVAILITLGLLTSQSR